jgi:hypothetical protein
MSRFTSHVLRLTCLALPGVAMVDGVLRARPGNFAFHPGGGGDMALAVFRLGTPPESLAAPAVTAAPLPTGVAALH